MKKIILALTLLVSSWLCHAQQLDINGDFRARLEYRDGYGTLKPDTLEAAAFVTQRARLNIDFAAKNLKMRISPQNYHVWGDVATTSKSDLGNAFHEAWAEAVVNKKFSMKLGRQEIVYDDHRIFGNVDWAMQARSHDAFVAKYLPDSNHTIHVGFALNANKETNFKENYLLPQYKMMQYLWYHGDFKSLGLSFLFLNNGMPFVDAGKEKIAYSQTTGARLTYKKGKFNADAAAYFQTGKIGLSDVAAQYYTANLNYKAFSAFTFGIGAEYLSGKAQDDATIKIKSFNPLYGTNHKFNGYMDYFYVGNHINSVGLMDLYGNFVYEKNKLMLKLQPHVFSAAAAVYQAGAKQDNLLGTEIDLTFAYKLFENVTIDGGISKMLATESMEALKGGNKDNGNYWGYLSMKFNPKLLSYKNEPKK